MQTDEKAVNIVFFILCFVPLAVSAFLSTNGRITVFHLFSFSYPMRGICFFRFFTGYRCPVCGMTRCFTYLIHGNLSAAWHMSHAGIFVFILCSYESVYRMLHLVFGKFKLYRLHKAVETGLIVITCVAVAFFFAAQFVNSSLIN